MRHAPISSLFDLRSIKESVGNIVIECDKTIENEDEGNSKTIKKFLK